MFQEGWKCKEVRTMLRQNLPEQSSSLIWPEDVSFPFLLGKRFLFAFDKSFITRIQNRIERPKI